MRSLLTLLFVCISSLMIAQEDIYSIQKEIDSTVWRPFKKAFEALNANDLNSLYAKDVLRVTPNGIDTKGLFKAKNIERFNTSKANGISIALDFWLDSRHTNEVTSYEVGFYRIAATNNGNTSYSYGQFHIVLQKYQGHWKITQDWDTTMINGIVIGKENFEKRQPQKF